MLEADCSSVLTTLLRYPSPQPYAPQSFVYDAIYLEQNPTTDRGNFIVAKYSGKPPDASSRLSQAGAKPGLGRRAQQLGDWKDMREGILPARSPASNSARGLETIFQDVSEGIQRRTETWGVAKVVRGAVSEARRSMQQRVQPEPLPRPDGHDNGHAKNASWAEESVVADLRTRVDELEERNRLFARSLSEAMNDLRSYTSNMNVEKDDAASVKRALTRVQSVQVCLEDPSAPLPEPEKRDVPREHTSSTSKTGAVKDSRTPSSAERQPLKNLEAKPKQPLPSRRSPRLPLADSEFSWMLGGDKNNRSSFVSSASVPPEQTRHQNQYQALFGGSEEANPKRSRESLTEPDGLAMRSLRGPKDELAGEFTAHGR